MINANTCSENEVAKWIHLQMNSLDAHLLAYYMIVDSDALVVTVCFGSMWLKKLPFISLSFVVMHKATDYGALTVVTALGTHNRCMDDDMALDTIQPFEVSHRSGELEKPPYVPVKSLSSFDKMRRWLRKYFLEGQHLDQDAQRQLQALPESPTWEDLIFIKYRKFIAMLIPFSIMQTVWWMVAIRHHFFQWYPDYWHMPVTMILGSFIGGITSEGSGAVAFPVMTLALHIQPSIARDFSIMIQSIGMTSALMCVLFMKVQFEVRAVILGTMGAIPGFIIGVHFIDPLFTGPQKKMLFVSIWTAFAFSLGILNSQKKRTTFKLIPDFCLWKGLVLVFTGFVGGIFDAFAGSGIDICIFSIITLLFRVTEKTATPTTVVLKGINAVFGFFYRGAMMGDISTMAWTYFALSVPVSATTGPLGSFLGSHLHRQVVAFAVYILELIALIGFLLTRPTWPLIAVGGKQTDENFFSLVRC